jgi:toxin ParE1/3/4
LKIVWTEQALVRLTEIQDFIARANPEAAERLVQQIAKRGEGLSKFPEMGRMVPELPETGLREIIEGRYRLVYRIQAKGIQIVTVFEGHRQFSAQDVVE